MFKKFASDALGLSDIGKIIPPADFDKVDSDDYILHEDQEKIFFLIKSKQDEYCFTNRALLHVDGKSAINTKKTLKRYEYYKYGVSGVSLETAGNIDLDVEIKFDMGGHSFSIDVDKKQIHQLKDLYKALMAISEIISSNQTLMGISEQSLDKAILAVKEARGETMKKTEEVAALNQYIFEWIVESRKKYVRKDFGEVFTKYINN